MLNYCSILNNNKYTRTVSRYFDDDIIMCGKLIRVMNIYIYPSILYIHWWWYHHHQRSQRIRMDEESGSGLGCGKDERTREGCVVFFSFFFCVKPIFFNINYILQNFGIFKYIYFFDRKKFIHIFGYQSEFWLFIIIPI